MWDYRALLLVFVGGGAGAVARFWLGRWSIDRGWADRFPTMTLAINAVGSFALGWLVVALADRPGWRLLLGTGVCGGFTTFSTFSLETLELLRAERYGSAAAYALLSVAAGLAGAWLGVRLARP